MEDGSRQREERLESELRRAAGTTTIEISPYPPCERCRLCLPDVGPYLPYQNLWLCNRCRLALESVPDWHRIAAEENAKLTSPWGDAPEHAMWAMANECELHGAHPLSPKAKSIWKEKGLAPKD